MIEKEGLLVVSPTSSAENSYYIPGTKTTAAISVGSAMDSQVLTELFTACVEGGKILGQPTEKYFQVLENLPKPTIASHGGLMEWLQDFEEPELGHRHVSHLFGVYPGSSITEVKLKHAAKVSIRRRLSAGGGHTSWSAAWLVCLYARLKDAPGAFSIIQHFLSHSTLKNMFGTHPPFQIDGNLGLTAGIAEILLQSHEKDRLYLLPCLPDEWLDQGTIKGLRARRGLTVDISWSKGKLSQCKILSSREIEIKCQVNLSLLPPNSSEEVSVVLKAGEVNTLLASAWMS